MMASLTRLCVLVETGCADVEPDADANGER
jgi:hypothetical protein